MSQLVSTGIGLHTFTGVAGSSDGQDVKFTCEAEADASCCGISFNPRRSI